MEEDGCMQAILHLHGREIDIFLTSTGDRLWMNIGLWKIFMHRLIRNGEVLEVREEPMVFYLPMTRMVRLRSRRQISVAQSIVTPMQCLGWGPICVALDWLLPWIRVTWLNKVVIVLCWWPCVVVLWSFNDFSIYLSSSSKKTPRPCWSLCSTTLHSGIAFLKEAIISPSYFMKNSTMTI